MRYVGTQAPNTKQLRSGCSHAPQCVELKFSRCGAKPLNAGYDLIPVRFSDFV
jgi:hypothetical protein